MVCTTAAAGGGTAVFVELWQAWMCFGMMIKVSRANKCIVPVSLTLKFTRMLYNGLVEHGNEGSETLVCYACLFFCM